MNAGGKGTIYKVKLKWRKIFDSDKLVKNSGFWPPEREEMTKEGQKLYDDLNAGKIFSGVTDDDFMDSRGLFANILNHHYDVIEDAAFKRWLKKNGYDAFYVKGDGPINVGVFSPSQVEIVEVYPANGKRAESLVLSNDDDDEDVSYLDTGVNPKDSEGCGCDSVGNCGCKQTHSALPSIVGRIVRRTLSRKMLDNAEERLDRGDWVR